MSTYQIHGAGLPSYTKAPNIYADINIGKVLRPNSGDDISVVINGSLLGLGGYDFFGYDLEVYVSLDSSQKQKIISKPYNDSTWGDYNYGLGDVTLTSTNTTTSCKLYVWVKSNCPCHPDGHGGNEVRVVQTISLTAPQAGNKPATPTITNNNKYNNNAAISASINSLTIGVSSTDWGKPDPGKIVWSCSNGSGGELSKTSQFTITGLSPGTTYTVTVYLKNTKGNSGSAKILIRTRHNPPVLGLSIDSVDLEKFNLSWTSDKDLADVKYRIDGGTWQKLAQTGKSGSFVAQWFEPKTTHTISFWGKSTVAYDSLSSYAIDEQGTTLDRAHITFIGDCIFGLTIEIDIASESTKSLKLEIWTEGNNLSPKFTFDVSKGTFVFNPTQDQLDKMYKCYPKSNEIPIKFLLTTEGDWKDWPDTQHDKTLQLTGIAKTGHIGVNNSARRCQVWWGDQNNTPRRCVAWIGDDSGITRRTI